MNYTLDEIRLLNLLKEELKKKNWVKLGEATLVRIPEIPGKIRKLEPDEHGNCKVEYICDRWYNKEKQQSRNSKFIKCFRL